MWDLFQRWFVRPKTTASVAEEEVLRLQGEAQTLRLDLQERNRLITTLQSDLERHRRGVSAQLAEAIQTRMEQIVTATASPIVQLLTQAHLLEVENRPVQVRDVLAVARRLIRILEEQGLILEGHVGETLAYDPNHHEPLNSAEELTPGQLVSVRFVGVTYRDKVLRKAGVERAGTVP
jgi:molecular chaperone GrpE (heat shock protein)